MLRNSDPLPATRGKPRRTTQKDIAEVLGVSIAAVSQSLSPGKNSTIHIPEKTVKKVHAVAKRLKYRPHAGARSIRTSRFQNMGFFFAKQGAHTHLPDDYLAGFHDAADRQGYGITLIRLPQQVDHVKARLPTLFDQHNLDALVIASFHYITKHIHERLVEDRLPVVYLNESQRFNAAFVDDVKGSEIMTRHLISRGHRKICFTHRKPYHDPDIETMHYSASARLEGYRNAMRAAGLEPTVVYFFADEVIGFREEFPDDWWEQVKGCDAIFASDDELVNRIARFFYEQKIRVPGDIALAGYNGDYAALSAWRRLTTIRVPAYEIGVAAFEMAQQLVEQPELKQVPSRVFVPELIKGETAG